MSKSVPVAVVGVGHMGRHHVRIYSEMPEAQLVGIVDANSDRAAEMAGQFNTQVPRSLHCAHGQKIVRTEDRSWGIYQG